MSKANRQGPGAVSGADQAAAGSPALPVRRSVVVLISGRGSNLGALLAADLPVHFAAVISNRADAAGLALAAEWGIPGRVLDHRAHPDRVSFDASLAAEIDAAFAGDQDGLVILAGFMRIFSPGFTARYAGRMINIHPSLLPAFTGLHTHQRALEEGVRVHGCTVHYVTAELDHGPVIAQAAVPVLPDDTETTLAARVLAQEHRLYPEVVRAWAEGRMGLDADGRVRYLADFGPDRHLRVPG